MKILLHMGQGKTGTTALQESLTAAAELLRTRNVLYPDFGRGFNNHQLLLALVGRPDRLFPTIVERFGGPECVVEAARVAWDMTCKDVRQSRPDILVLSSEYIIGADGLAKAEIGKLLSELSADITPVIYVRHPVDHYRARLQQRLKSSDRRSPPRDANLNRAIHDTEAAFLQRPQLVAFDRKILVGGDIVEDFATRFLAPWVKADELPRLQANVGLSAEALVFMARLRAERGGNYAASRQVARLISRLEAFDRSDPPAQPFTLLPEVAEAALRSATSYRWLAETGQLEIPGLDVSRIDGAPVPDWMNTAAPETLFLHDPKRLDRLRGEMKVHEPKRKVGVSPKGKSANPNADPKPRLRDLLLRFLQQKLASVEGRKTGAAPLAASPARRSTQGDRNEET